MIIEIRFQFLKIDFRGTAKTSIDNLIGILKGQVEYMETYAENIQRAMEMGVDEGIVRKLSDGSEESVQILAAIVQGGEEDIAALNEELAKVEEGKENFSNTVAERASSKERKRKSRNWPPPMKTRHGWRCRVWNGICRPA